MISEEDYLFYRNLWIRRPDDGEYKNWKLQKTHKGILPEGWDLIDLAPFFGPVPYANIIAEGICFHICLDYYGFLGSFHGGPYWEIFNSGGFSFKCAMEEPEKIIEAIQGELARCKSQK